MNSTRFSITIKWITAAAAVLLFVLVVVIVVQYAQMGSLHAKKNNLEANLEKLYEQQATLDEAIENRSSIAFAEQFARENLGMIKDGDKIFKIK